MTLQLHSNLIAPWLALCESPQLDTPAKERLLATLFEAHRTAATDNANLSKALVNEAARGSLNFITAIIAGLSCLGGVHAPVTAARKVIYFWPRARLQTMINCGAMIPGWGNAFFKDKIDPAFVPLARLLVEEYPKETERLDAITELLRPKKLLPNAAAYTAVTAELLGLHFGLEVALFLAPRLPVWAMKAKEHLTEGKYIWA